MINKPHLIITDFDRTIAYLYRDTTLLTDLSNRIIDFYSKFIEIPPRLNNRNRDGYHVWHDLHDVAEEILHEAAENINKQAEDLVTDFEIEVLRKVGILEGIKETCYYLKEIGIQLAIVSNNAEKAIRYALKIEGIEDLFDYIGGRPYPFSPSLIKPNPYPLEQAIKALGTKHSNLIWYTGDDVMDMVAAKRANIVGVGIYFGRHSKQELIDHGADITFASFNELISFFNKI